MLIDFPEADDTPSQCLALTLNSEYVLETLHDLNIKNKKINDDSLWIIQDDIFYITNSKGLAGATNNIVRILTEDNPLKDSLAELAVKELLIRLMHSQGNEVLKTNKYNGRFAALIQYIKTNLHEKLHMDKLANFAQLSKANFHKLFKQELGVSPNDFINQQRIHKAKKLLQEQKNVNEVAYETGFSDANYFIKLFKKQEGITPKHYQVQQLLLV